MTEERNSGRNSGSGEFGADLWVEAMVSKGLKWVQSWRAEGQTGGGEQGQAMSPRGRKSGRRSSVFGSQVRATGGTRALAAKLDVWSKTVAGISLSCGKQYNSNQCPRSQHVG